MCVTQVTVSDATAPWNFSCQLTSNILTLELLSNNMNKCYGSTSRRHSRPRDNDEYDVSVTDTSATRLDVTSSSDLGSRRTSNLERPLGFHQGDLGDDMAVTEEEPANADDSRADNLDSDDDDAAEDADMLLTVDQLHPGLCCAARYVTDGCWYRARVKSVEGEAVQIVFIDYGTEAAVGVADLRWLKEHFTSTKMMSFQCSLEGWDGESGADEVEQFQQQVLDRRLIADVLSTDEHDSVKYVVRLLDMGLSVGDRLKNPDVYKPVTVCVTSATSPHDFWCRCVDDASTTELPLLMDLIADLYSGTADDEPSVDSPVDLVLDDGMLYAARYTDGVWYRAKVISSQQSTPATVNVLFVDYGTKTEVLASDLRPLPDNCLTLPPQAVHCSLAGIEPTAGDAVAWDDASVSRFVELVMCEDDERELRLHPVSVVRNADGDVVELCGRLMAGDNDIGAQLVQSGYVVDSAGVKRGSLSDGEQRRRRSSCLSEQRCNLFVMIDGGSDDIARNGVGENLVEDDEAKGGDTTADVVNDLVVEIVDRAIVNRDAVTGDEDEAKRDTVESAAAAEADDKTDAVDDDSADDEFTEAVESLGK